MSCTKNAHHCHHMFLIQEHYFYPRKTICPALMTTSYCIPSRPYLNCLPHSSRTSGNEKLHCYQALCWRWLTIQSSFPSSWCTDCALIEHFTGKQNVTLPVQGTTQILSNTSNNYKKIPGSTKDVCSATHSSETTMGQWKGANWAFVRLLGADRTITQKDWTSSFRHWALKMLLWRERAHHLRPLFTLQECITGQEGSSVPLLPLQTWKGPELITVIVSLDGMCDNHKVHCFANIPTHPSDPLRNCRVFRTVSTLCHHTVDGELITNSSTSCNPLHGHWTLTPTHPRLHF